MSTLASPTRTFSLEPAVVWAMWRRELLRYARDRSQIFGGFSRTVLWLIILGFGLGASFRDIEGYTYAQYIFPGVITLNILFAALQSAVALVWDREVGLLREVLVSPAPMLSVALGKLLGGASVAVIQGSIPLLFAPLIGVSLSLSSLLLAWGVMALLGLSVTGFGVVLASRMATFEGFGSISNGVIQPLYFLSGSIFPLKGIIGGVGFLDLPDALRRQLELLGIHTIGGGWVVQLPVWLQVLVYANPVTYFLDLLRAVSLRYQQLPMAADLAVVAIAPLLTTLLATLAMSRMRRR
ncbi:ABC transporter permease [Calidithermus roseus]|uniref:Transport permease protein n=1 Tax=Calidithermus roseus TaxID=1644118 RepID=A0A399EVD5_9DEIN|nr:ABC transporter permease [Calidithermus roseus]RIH87550.1 Inner membrane transport permease YbhR [Calidithermus roseus]